MSFLNVDDAANDSSKKRSIIQRFGRAASSNRSGSNQSASNQNASSQSTLRKAITWVGIWFVIGLGLRLTNLTLKAAWMDEVATTIFSLGNYSRLIPLNEIINLEQILQPLAVTPDTTAQDVVRHLLTEDNHPPTYFVLAHWWMKLFPAVNGYASLWGERSLSAILGALAIPATYLLAQFSFQPSGFQNSERETSEARTVAVLCAALMALSPFGIFMAQEARHYTLAILAVIASLCCFVIATKAIQQHQIPSWRVILAWITINTVGLTVHFFVGLTLIAEGMTLLLLLIQQYRADSGVWTKIHWRRIYAAALGTLAGGLLWLPILLNFYGSPQTSFLKSGGRSWQFWVNPIVQSIVSWLYVILSPVTGGYSWQAVVIIVVTCVGFLLLYTPWLLATLRKSLQFQCKQPSLRLGIRSVGGFFVMANVLFLLICYGAGFDITRGHRYSFVFFPSVVLLFGVGLAPFWQEQGAFATRKLPCIPKRVRGQHLVAGVLAIALFGSLVIVNHYSNLKFYRPERFIDLMQANSSHPVIVGTSALITEQPSVVGIEIMSVAWEIERQARASSRRDSQETDSALTDNTTHRWVEAPRFIIAETNPNKGLQAEAQLSEALATVSSPFDLWLLSMGPDLSSIQCQLKESGNKGSSAYTHYTCPGSSS